MSIEVKNRFNGDRVMAKISSAWDRGLPQLTEEILNDSNQYVKVDKHTLEESALRHSRPQDGVIIWKTPYARRQYWEIQTARKDANHMATWKWFHVAKVARMRIWERQAQRLVGGGL